MNGRSVLYILALAAVALFSWGLARSTAGGNVPETPISSGGGEVLAVVGGEEITRREVELGAGPQLVQLRSQIYDLTEQSLKQMIDGKLLELEAEKRGVETDALLYSVIDSIPPEPTSAQVDSVFEQFRERIDQPREVVEPQIEAFLLNQARQARFDSLIAALRIQHEVTNYLDPPRFEVADTGPFLGSETAPVTIVEFSDFECPFCKRINPTLKQLLTDYEGRIRLVFRQFPLNSIHPNAQKAAEASLCADAQGRFWDMHDAMFDSSRTLNDSNLKLIAEELGLDGPEFVECLDTGEFADAVAADLSAGRALGISGTPALFINGRFLSGAQPYEVISRVVDDELQRRGA